MGFWENFDYLKNKNKKELKKICEELNIDYLNIKNQRHLNRVPKVEQIIMFAKYFNCSIDFLLTGKDFEPSQATNPKFKHLIETIASKLILWDERKVICLQNLMDVI